MNYKKDSVACSHDESYFSTLQEFFTVWKEGDDRASSGVLAFPPVEPHCGRTRRNI
jgi:hypothetical protein